MGRQWSAPPLGGATPAGVGPEVVHLCWPLLAKQTLGAAAPWRVVADAYFSKAPFINWMLWMLSLKAPVITHMRSDGVGWDDPELATEALAGRKTRQPRPGQQWKIAELLKVLPLTPVSVLIYGQLKRLEIVTPVDQGRGGAEGARSSDQTDR